MKALPVLKREVPQVHINFRHSGGEQQPGGAVDETSIQYVEARIQEACDHAGKHWRPRTKYLSEPLALFPPERVEGVRDVDAKR